MRHQWLDVVQQIFGWSYFLAWTISFYPQVWLNWRRKSVVGYSFDLLAFNILGYIAYSLFNLGMYCIPAVKHEYFHLHPGGVLPVMLNDVFFAVHALLVCCILLIQTLIYERGEQRISHTCLSVLGITIAYCTGFAGLAILKFTTWLSFLYQLSYVKVFVTFFKYVPQAILNFRLKSTIGWSIGNVMLDFTGGVLSILQIFIVAYNEDDWGSVSRTLGKLGLGLCSVSFDILFMVQHFCLYPSATPIHRRPFDASSKDKRSVVYTILSDPPYDSPDSEISAFEDEIGSKELCDNHSTRLPEHSLPI